MPDVIERIRNSYCLETTNGEPLSGEFHARQLRAFHPREGTKLAEEQKRRESEPQNEEDRNTNENANQNRNSQDQGTDEEQGEEDTSLFSKGGTWSRGPLGKA
jgi:hypothetical protein